jgi:phosphonate transport system substrate-binding protein
LDDVHHWTFFVRFATFTANEPAMKTLILCLSLIMLVACSPLAKTEVAGSVDLNDLQPLPTPVGHDAAPLRVAVAAVISPKGTVQSYSPLLLYLEKKLNRPVVLVQRKTYLEVNDLIERGEVDVAFVCTSAYIEGHDTFGMELLAAPQVNGKVVYNSVLIVPSSSTARNMMDLRGKVFAFTDPISLSGRVYPTYLVHQLGYSPDEFFARVFFTYSHDEAIRAVASGVADGAAVDSLVFEFALARDPTLAETLRVIHRSPDLSECAFARGGHLDPAAQECSDLETRQYQNSASQTRREFTFHSQARTPAMEEAVWLSCSFVGRNHHVSFENHLFGWAFCPFD